MDAQIEGDLRRLLVSLLQGFYWFDEGLQNYMQARGWPAVTRPQSMVMANIALGVRRPSEIARRLGVSRQAIHATLQQMSELGMVALTDDPSNGRVKEVAVTEQGDRMRRDAQRAMALLSEELSRRQGGVELAAVARFLGQDWGPAMTFDAADVGHHD